MTEASTTSRYAWSRLNHLQVGRYAKYLVKMEFALLGISVFGAEVDDRGLDLVVIEANGNGGYFRFALKRVADIQQPFKQRLIHGWDNRIRHTKR
ncbi:MAG: hypothetical protein AB7V46_10800 [Thermomicrobiales bacterium]